ncbi:MAG: hypothetical protein GX640_15225 [Fibrobacter sp.]|nr:hypothetical protein [Fibrobacter sp.]
MLVFFDISVITIMIILAYLSKRLGDALKILPYYKGLYITASLIACASGLDFLRGSKFEFSLPVLSISIRFIASGAAIFICFKYWKWLFSEFLKS